jgi:hypothetical protein
VGKGSRWWSSGKARVVEGGDVIVMVLYGGEEKGRRTLADQVVVVDPPAEA